MVQFAFLMIGLLVLTLVIAYVFKKYQRVILWTTALILFVGTALSLGFGLVKIEENGVVNQSAIFAVIFTFVCSAIFACGAEKIHEASLKKVSSSAAQSNEAHEEKASVQEPLEEEEIPNDDEEVPLPAKLDTQRARDLFSRAIEAGLMEKKANHYKWKGSKVQLAYMCGRIYCEDHPQYDRIEKKTYWRFGRTDFFPDSELNDLFEETDLGQSRANRKDLAVPQGGNKKRFFYNT